MSVITNHSLRNAPWDGLGGGLGGGLHGAVALPGAGEGGAVWTCVFIMLGQERAAGEALQLDLESFSLFICLKEF